MFVLIPGPSQRKFSNRPDPTRKLCTKLKQQYYNKLLLQFEDDTYEGMRGGVYLKLRVGKLGWAHNKKLLMDYMYNRQHLFHQVRNLNRSLPDLPPLIEDVGVFVYFVPSEHVLNQLHHAADGLSPWTTATRKFKVFIQH